MRGTHIGQIAWDGTLGDLSKELDVQPQGELEWKNRYAHDHIDAYRFGGELNWMAISRTDESPYVRLSAHGNHATRTLKDAYERLQKEQEDAGRHAAGNTDQAPGTTTQVHHVTYAPGQPHNRGEGYAVLIDLRGKGHGGPEYLE